MSVQIVVQPVGEGVHELAQPGRALFVLLLHSLGVDEQLHPQVAVELARAFGFGEPAHRVKVIHLDTIEVVLSLRIKSTEDGIGISLAVDVRNTPAVALYCDVGCTLFPACEFRGGD